MKKSTFFIIVFVLLSHTVSFSQDQAPNTIEIDASGNSKFTPEKGQMDLNETNTLLVLKDFDSDRDFGVQFKSENGEIPLNKDFLTDKREGDRITVEIKEGGSIKIDETNKQYITK